MGTWYISKDGSTWTTLAAAGISNARLSLRAMGADELTFSVPGDAFAVAAFAYGDDVILKYDSTVRFRGSVRTMPRQAVGQRESLTYGATGGWWWLEQITYAQTWQLLRSSDNELVPVPKPRIVIGEDDSGNRRTLAQEIEAVIDFAIAAGAPLQKGTIDEGPLAPLSEHTNMRCAEVIAQCLRFLPDRVAWFDHSTAPYPTFHCRSIDNLAACAIDIAATNAESVDLTPRYDLQIPGLRIVYEMSHSHDGYDYASYALDSAGVTTDPRCLDLLFELGGSQETFMSQEIETADYPDSPYTEKAFWVGMFDWLSGIDPDDLTIDDVTRGGEHDYPRFLTKGSIQDWMSVDWEDEVWAVAVSYIRRDGEGNSLERVESKKLRITLRSTDGTSRKYRKLASYQAAEAVPDGVAAALFASWSRLHWSGTLSLVEAEASFVAGPWSKVGLTNGLADWADMAAAVQQAEMDIESGTTRLTLGPSGILEADSLVALFRAARARRYSYRAPQRINAAQGGAESEGSFHLPRERPSEADPGEMRQLRVSASIGEGEETIKHVVEMDPLSIAFEEEGDEGDQAVQLREVLIPELDGDALVAKKRQVMASESYGIPQPLGSGGVFEWDQTVAGNIVTADGGQIKNSSLTIPAVDPVDIQCDFTSVPVDEYRYLFAEINLALGTVDLKQQAARPVDDPPNRIVRRALALYKMTATGPVFQKYLHRGAIQLDGIYSI